MNDNARSGGLSLFTVLFVIFLVLKLTGNIDWSWWWVTAPLWGPLVLVVVFALLFYLIALIVVGVKELFK